MHVRLIMLLLLAACGGNPHRPAELEKGTPFTGWIEDTPEGCGAQRGGFVPGSDAATCGVYDYGNNIALESFQISGERAHMRYCTPKKGARVLCLSANGTVVPPRNVADPWCAMTTINDRCPIFL